MQSHTVFVFDLDGVITNPHDSTINKQTLHYIHMLLTSPAYVAINTGRPFAWIKQNLLDPLIAIDAKNEYKHIFIACEKGGEGIHRQNGAMHILPSRFALPETTRALAHHIYNTGQTTKYTAMSWDGTKRTMITIEKRPESSLEVFRTQQKLLVSELETALAGHSARIDSTTIAIDVEAVEAGKHAGAELIYEWIQNCEPEAPKTFISFGDSISDYEMARYFAAQHADTTFVFVGRHDTIFKEDPGVTLLRTQATYADGTNEYLAAIT